MSREAEINEIAYRLWEEDGRPEGRDAEHWFRAEAIVAESLAKNRAAKAKPAAAGAEKPAAKAPSKAKAAAPKAKA